MRRADATVRPHETALPRLPDDLSELFENCSDVLIASTTEELLALAARDAELGWHEVAYEVPDVGRHVEARVCNVRNGIAINYTEPYMRRRDPDCMVIGDELPTDKERYVERFGEGFEELRAETLSWLREQELAAFFFMAGGTSQGLPRWP